MRHNKQVCVPQARVKELGCKKHEEKGQHTRYRHSTAQRQRYKNLRVELHLWPTVPILSLTHNPLSCVTMCSGNKDILTSSIFMSFDLFRIFVKSPIYKHLKQTQQVMLFSRDQSRA